MSSTPLVNSMRLFFARAALLCGATFVLASCHGLLDVSDPTRVQDADIANALGANARRLQVSSVFNANMGPSVLNVALFTDEANIDASSGAVQDPTLYLDRRDGVGYENINTTPTGAVDPYLGGWDQIVTAADIAIPAVRAYSPDSVKGDFLSQLFALRGFSILQMAEDVCSGFPINEVQNDLPVFNPPYTTDSAVKYALGQLDSALMEGHDSARFINLARVAQGRAFLDLGQYAAAATAVAQVPTSFVYQTEGYNGATTAPGNYCYGCLNFVMGDYEGVNGLPFVSSQDPRVPAVPVGLRYGSTTDSIYFQGKYTTGVDPVIVASGVEARLIEAEVALHDGDPNWLTILNTLRMSAGVTPMTDPGTPSAQVDSLYHERAFWLYFTGRRLGDMRRLVRNYGRDPATVFPQGAYPLGGTYSTDTAIPYVYAAEHAYNPYITSSCPAR